MTFIKERISDITFETQNGVMYKWDDKLGTNFYFSDHHRKIMRNRFGDNDDERKKLYNIQITDHPYLNKTFIYKGEKYIVDTIHKQWYIGYFLVMLYKNENNSHGQLIFENISCHEPSFVKDTKRRKVKEILKQLNS